MIREERSESSSAKWSRDKDAPGAGVLRRLKLAFYTALVVVLLADFLPFHTTHAVFFWHKLPGFDALYGLLSCIVVVLFSKALGRMILQRREDFYDD